MTKTISYDIASSPIDVRELEKLFIDTFKDARETLAESKWFDNKFVDLFSDKLKNLNGTTMHVSKSLEPAFQEFINDTREAFSNRMHSQLPDQLKLLRLMSSFDLSERSLNESIDVVSELQEKYNKFDPKTPEQAELFYKIGESIIETTTALRQLLQQLKER